MAETDYKLSYTGAQVNSAVNSALNPDSAPTLGSSKLITSNGVKQAIDSLQTSLGGQISASNGRISTLEYNQSAISTQQQTNTTNIAKNASDVSALANELIEETEQQVSIGTAAREYYDLTTDTISETKVTASSLWRSKNFEVTAGQKVIIDGRGTTNVVKWAVTDASNVVIKRKNPATATVEREEIEITSNGKFFFNLVESAEKKEVIIVSKSSKLDKIKEAVEDFDDVKDSVETLEEQTSRINGDLYTTKTLTCSDILTERKGYIDANGGLSTSGTITVYSNYQDCEGYSKIEISVMVLTTTPIQCLAFYDADKTFISSIKRIKGDEAGSQIVTYDIPENAAYFRTTYFNAENAALYGAFYCKLSTGEIAKTTINEQDISALSGEIDSLNDAIDELDSRISASNGADNTLVLNQQDIVELNIVGSDGNVSANSAMGCTDYIPCRNAETLIYKQVVGLTGAGIAFYNQSKQKISYTDSIEGTNGYATKTISIPSGAYYFRASGWNYTNSLTYGSFSASLNSPDICVNGKRATNGESTFFSVCYNSAILDLTSTSPSVKHLDQDLVCTTGVVLLPSSYTMKGKKSRVIINFHGWSHYVNYKQWGAAGDDYLGFMVQKQRWADAGYVVIDCNHKTSAQKGQYSGLGSIQDEEAYRKCFEWVKEHYNVEETCFIVCGSAGGPNGINCCYNWPEVRASVWLDTWVDVSEHAYPSGCGNYYYGYNSTTGYDETKVGNRNPVKRIMTIGDTTYLQMPRCSCLVYPLQNGTNQFFKPFLDIINAGHAYGDFYIRRVSGIQHSDLVSGGDGTNANAAIIDAEIINFLNQH